MVDRVTEDRVFITDIDAARLQDLTASLDGIRGEDRMTILLLRKKLKGATVVPWHAMRVDVVTMQSRVILRDENSGQTLTCTLVFPEEADYSAGRISVFAPIGAAILGLREGSLAEWEGSVGTLRLRIKKVLHQPEAAAAPRG